MRPDLGAEASRLIVLMAMQTKPIYMGTALPKNPQRRAKRLKMIRREDFRQDKRDLAEARAS